MQTLVWGLLGLPPVNGVLPQAPMHTRSLAHIRKQHQQQQHNGGAAAGAGAAADHACTIHSSNGSESDWVADSHDNVGLGAGARPGVAAVTESLSQLQLGRAGQADRQTRSTATYPHGASIQQPDGVHSVTAALSHMHIDTPAGANDACEQPFNTPRATAAFDSQLQPFDSAPHTAPMPGAAALRHRQRSLSPTASQGVTAGGSSAPQPQQRRQQGPAREQQQQQRGGRGRLHPSGSDVAINTMPDSAGAGPGAVGQHDGGPVPPEQGTYLHLEVGGGSTMCTMGRQHLRSGRRPASSNHRAGAYHPSRLLVPVQSRLHCATDGLCCQRYLLLRLRDTFSSHFLPGGVLCSAGA